MAASAPDRTIGALMAWLVVALAAAAPVDFGRAIGRLIAWATLAFVAAPAVAAPTMPEPPRSWRAPESIEVTGRTLVVPPDGDLNQALTDANRGDEIVLAAGAVYRGPFVLPFKAGDGWITVRSSGEAALEPGVRVGPDDTAHMAVLEASAGHAAVVSVEPRASHYRLIGLEIRPERGAFLHNVVAFGRGDETEASLPHHLVIERCYIHGDPIAGARRGVALNAAHGAIVDSHLADFKEVGADSQAIGGWNGPGPFSILNNHVEGAGENLMFGGETARIAGLVPSDIVIRGNYFTKPVEWMAEHPRYAGKPWAVKNLLELKNARRVVIDGNVFEHSWAHGQTGFAVLFTVRNEGGEMPWAAVHDVAFTNNVIRRAGNGINLLGADTNERGDAGTRRILIENNHFTEIGGAWGGGRLFQILNGTDSVIIRGNYAEQTGSIVVSGGASHENFVFSGNAAPHNRYGIVGSGSAPGVSTLATHFPGAQVSHNAISGGSARLYPAGNTFPSDSVRGRGGLDLAALCRALADANPLVEDVRTTCTEVDG